jgi:protein-S-isoprenylcysteine O-methyltransferase Ste14
MNKQLIFKAGSLAALMMAVAAMIFLLERNSLLATNYAGMAVQILAVGLMVWARFTFGMRSFHAAANTTTGKLVTNGPYRLFRHPIYASIIYFVWAGVLSNPLKETIGAGAIVTAGLVTRLLLEETFLRVSYPDYETYSRQTKRIIPFLF